MKAASHRALGQFLAEAFLSDTAGLHCRAFLFGCVQPDRNPMTYAKGSVRSQWLRGHNWGNANRFIFRLIHRLEARKTLSLWDYYCLGKLIHYTADAFTLPHNTHCPFGLRHHRDYERKLQEVLLAQLPAVPPTLSPASGSLSHALRDYRLGYMLSAPDLLTDARFILDACCTVTAAICGKYASVV